MPVELHDGYVFAAPLKIKTMHGNFSESKKNDLFCRYLRRGIRLVFK